MHGDGCSLGVLWWSFCNMYKYWIFIVYAGGTPKTEFIYKNLCIYAYMFKLQSPSKDSPFRAIDLSRLFPSAQNSYWTCRFWRLLVLLSFFVSPLPHWQNVSLWGLFSSRERKKRCTGRYQVNREGGAWESRWFWSNTAEHSAHCGQVSL